MRQIFFFDTPDLALNAAGVVVRARRIQDSAADSVVKLRPVVPDDLPKKLRKDPSFGVEVDAMPGGFVCSASLKGRTTKKDTVLILIAGHGTVETPGSKGAFILTHDSDPQDLKGTSLPMAEVQTLINDELSKVGRVAVFVDVCRAGNIGSIKNTTVNTVVEKLGEAEGEILGLTASRPKELSYEGPEFGGGHTMIIAGGTPAKLVVYPIAEGRHLGTLLTNWVVCVRTGRAGGLRAIVWEGSK